MSSAFKKRYIITGTSSGIGLALANALLQDEHTFVAGISRRNFIKHPRFTHHQLDLSNVDDVGNFTLPIDGDETETVLINNAGWVGEIAPMGQQDFDAITECLNINLTSPSILINQFISRVHALTNRRVIVNISSGAGKYPIKSWGTYCTSKAGLDMLTRVINEEHPQIESYAISPGVVDTAMQQSIRNAKPALFEDLDRFVDLKNQGNLDSPEQVAQKIIHLINNSNEIPEKVFSLRDLNPNKK